jgi:murein L,D-transpeptidase YcbB/YkuD
MSCKKSCFRSRLLILATAALAAAGAGNVFGMTSGDSIPSVEQQSGTGAELQALLHGQDSGTVRGARSMRDSLTRFYEARDYQPVWSGSAEAVTMAGAVRAILRKADEQGLHAADYAATASRWEAAPTAGREAAEYDLSLTADLLRYAHDVRLGRTNPRDIYRDVELPKPDFNAAEALNEALRHHSLTEFLADLPPSHPEYRRLVAALAKYRANGAKTGDASARIGQIVANMERWRWMPRQFEHRFVRVNVPDQSVDFVRDGEVVLHSKVIIGRKNNATPILRTMITSVVANPPWNIPGDIAAQMTKNPSYLAAHHMVMVGGQLQQLPPSALGYLMLDSPNRFDVYLHDTPAKALFDKDNREISHGCVRVQEILSLASLVLADDRETGMDRLKKTIASGHMQRLALDQPVPLYMLYWTAVADEDGAVEFHTDHYNRDRPLIAALGGSAETSQ